MRTIDCVMPAAGYSTRMGRPKLLLPFAGGSLVGCSVGNALAAGLRIILVLGRDADGIEAIFRDEARVQAVRNPDPSRGMLSSIQEGITRVTSERFFIIPADMPFVGPAIFRRIAATPSEGPLFPVFEGRRGHPVLIPSRLIPAILALPPDETLRSLLAACSPSCIELPDDSILRDLDTEEEYREAMGE